MRLREVGRATLLLSPWLTVGVLGALAYDLIATFGAAPRPAIYWLGWVGWTAGVPLLLPRRFILPAAAPAAMFLLFLQIFLATPRGAHDLFLSDLESVGQGMSQPRVQAVLQAYELLYNGPSFPDPERTDALGQLHNHSQHCVSYRCPAQGHAAGIAYVCFSDGAVVGTDFHPD